MQLEKLTQHPLFKNLTAQQIQNLLQQIKPREVKYHKGNTILDDQQTMYEIGILIKGKAFIEKSDAWGNRFIIDYIKEGQIFAETFACLNIPSHVHVIAIDEVEVMYLPLNELLKNCNQITQNFIERLADKNLNLSRKVEIVTQRSIRSKLLTYLSLQAQIHQSNRFKIPYNRQQLADYLAIDRSAMCVELSKLAKENFIQYKKNDFQLKGINEF